MDEGHDSPVPVAELALAVGQILGGPVEFTPVESYVETANKCYAVMARASWPSTALPLLVAAL